MKQNKMLFSVLGNHQGKFIDQMGRLVILLWSSLTKIVSLKMLY